MKELRKQRLCSLLFTADCAIHSNCLHTPVFAGLIGKGCDPCNT